MDFPIPTNHVFVDFENVCEIDATILENKNVIFVLLVGAGLTRLDATLVEKLFLHAASVHLVRLTSRGKNALDFALAYYLGQAAAADPKGCFHIVSKDKGFDPLIEHLQSKHIHARRHDDFTTITFPGRPKLPAADQVAGSPRPKTPHRPKTVPPGIDDLAVQVLAQLRKTPANLPKRRKALVSYLNAHFGRDTAGADADTLIENLSQTGNLAIDTKGAVTYWLE
jgi:hypothetical protein